MPDRDASENTSQVAQTHHDGAGKPLRLPVIGLLGGIGSGKSTVARAFAQLGCGIVDADALARAALQSDAVRQTLVEWWGSAVLDQAGAVDRAAVARIIFEAPSQKHRLEALIHPRVREGRARLHARFHDDPAIRAIVEDCPLLLETGLDKECDVLVFVEASQVTRLARVMNSRGWSESELLRREKNQMPLDRKRAVANYVVVNDAEACEPSTSVSRVLSLILQSHATD